MGGFRDAETHPGQPYTIRRSGRGSASDWSNGGRVEMEGAGLPGGLSGGHRCSLPEGDEWLGSGDDCPVGSVEGPAVDQQACHPEATNEGDEVHVIGFPRFPVDDVYRVDVLVGLVGAERGQLVADADVRVGVLDDERHPPVFDREWVRVDDRAANRDAVADVGLGVVRDFFVGGIVVVGGVGFDRSCPDEQASENDQERDDCEESGSGLGQHLLVESVF